MTGARREEALALDIDSVTCECGIIHELTQYQINEGGTIKCECTLTIEL